MTISMFDLERSITDLEDKNSKFDPLPVSFAYGPKVHSYTFIALSYQNCRSSRKRVKSAKNGYGLDIDLVVKGVC